MSREKIEVFVCVNVDCKSRGAAAVMSGLQQRLETAGDDAACIEVKPYVCFSACNSGPNLVIPSRRCWYSGVTPPDLDAVADYLRGGPEVLRLRQQNDPDLEQLIFDIIEAGLIPDAD
jgi:(2Fe-2S) ferredoxin